MSHARPTVDTPLPATVWTACEIRLDARATYMDPFRDVEVVARFRGPGGRVLDRPAFWDGGSVWRVRFAPTCPGRWTWSTSGPTADPGLHGRTGRIDAAPYRGTDAFRRHGFLKVAPGRRHLCHADGTPFFWLGDTHWLWEQERLDGTGPDFHAMARTRVRQGFNVYQVELFDRWDGDQPNLRLFQGHIDTKWRWLAEHGIAAACTHGLLTTRPGPDTAPREAAMARYLCARYGAYPAVWPMFQECTGHYGQWFENEAQRAAFRDVVRAVGRAYRRHDAYGHPRTAHSDAPLLTWFRGKDWLDFTLLQGGHEERIDRDGYHALYFDDAHRVCPLIEGEANYEALYEGADPGRPAPISTAAMRGKAWQAMLAGCAGITYGANGVWQAIEQPGDSDLHRVYGRTRWTRGIALPGADQLGHLKRFFTGFAWHRLVPRPACDGFCTGPAVTAPGDRPVVASDQDGRRMVAYLPERCGDGAVLRRLGAGPWNAAWFDPRTGARRPIGAVRPIGGAWTIPMRPTDDDWVVHLEARGSARLEATPSRWGDVRAERERDQRRNRAGAARVSCSSNDAARGIYAPERAVDGDTNPGSWTHWSSDAAKEVPSEARPAWLALEWPAPVEIAEVRLTFKSEYVVSRYALEVDGQVVATVDANREDHRDHGFVPPIRVRRLRFLGMRGPDIQPEIVRLVEIEVLGPRER